MALPSTHPLGVQPDGNRWLGKERSRRSTSLGPRLASLSDALLLEVLSYAAGSDLATLARTSHHCRVFAYHEELWKSLVLQGVQTACNAGGNEVSVNFVGGCWRATYAALASPGAVPCVTPALNSDEHPPRVVAPGCYSDLLFKTFLCASAEVDARWLARDDIPRRSGRGMTPAQFQADFEAPNMPVILTDVVTQWPAFTDWTDDYLESVCGAATLDGGSFPFTMRSYNAYSRSAAAGHPSSAGDDQPLYLFDSSFADKVPALARDYPQPPFVEDLFCLLGGAARPDYRWLICGPAGSGSVWHKDPNATSAWNGVVRGSKLWLMFPPEAEPPGVHASADGAQVATVMCPMEWLCDFGPAALRERELAGRRGIAGGRGAPHEQQQGSAGGRGARAGEDGAANGTAGPRLKSARRLAPGGSRSAGPPGPSHNGGGFSELLAGVCRAGEMMFVPRGWWHLVLNLEPGVAVTQNFVSPAGLPHVLRFLRDKPFAVSGVGGSEARAHSLHADLLEAVRGARPELLLQVQQAAAAAGGGGCSSADAATQGATQGAPADTTAGAAAAPEGPDHGALTGAGRVRWRDVVRAGDLIDPSRRMHGAVEHEHAGSGDTEPEGSTLMEAAFWEPLTGQHPAPAPTGASQFSFGFDLGQP